MTVDEAIAIIHAMPEGMNIDEYCIKLVMSGAEYERRQNAEFVYQFFKVADPKGATVCSHAIKSRGENGQHTND